jgi:hypothetical protein
MGIVCKTMRSIGAPSNSFSALASARRARDSTLSGGHRHKAMVQ